MLKNVKTENEWTSLVYLTLVENKCSHFGHMTWAVKVIFWLSNPKNVPNDIWLKLGLWLLRKIRCWYILIAIKYGWPWPKDNGLLWPSVLLYSYCPIRLNISSQRFVFWSVSTVIKNNAFKIYPGVILILHILGQGQRGKIIRANLKGPLAQCPEPWFWGRIYNTRFSI